MKTSRFLLLCTAALAAALIGAPAVEAAKTCYDCHTKEKQLYSSRKTMHQPVREENCESCHKRHGFAQSLILQNTTNDLCYTCHADLKTELNKAHVHFPVTDGKCWDCHDPHASDKKGLLRAAPEGIDDPNACLMCHKNELQASLDGKVHHEPFANLNCVACHSPHASDNSGLLTAPIDQLCGSCHKPTDSKMTKAHADKHAAGLACSDCHSGHSQDTKGLLSENTHEPFASGDCETCHSLPDDQGNVALPEGTTVSGLCTTCHSDIADKTGLAHPHDAVTADNCEDCHQPHSSRFGNLLLSPESELCGQCHSDILTSSGKTPHLPVVLGQCSSCHEVHGSANAKLVAKTDASLCLDCHADFKTKHDSSKTIHVGAEDCLTCHAPHEGLHAGILRKNPSELCLDCHAVDTEALSAVTGHQPYLASDCIACHLPHHSDTPHLVRGEGSATCVGCHADVQKRLTMTNPHPAAVDDCGSCHVPHYSETTKHLLSTHEKELCQTCHSYEDLNMTAEFVHTPARMGDCSGCHNPHGAMQENLVTGRMRRVNIQGKVISQLPTLTGISSDLCFTCHDDLATEFRKPGTHQPVMAGDCDACHSAHGSGHLGFVKAAAPELCAGCHTIDDALNAKHEGYTITGADCLDCHNPHVSDQPKLVRSSLHPPFAEKSCDACHEKGAQGEAVVTASMTEICAACHESVSEGAGLAHQHVPFAAGECTGCHGVHAADKKGLLKADDGRLCFSCHEDVRDQTDLAVQHKPFTEGKCLDCHRPHSSQFASLTNKPAETFCIACHTDLSDRIKKGTPHAPVVSGDCSACHKAHAGDTESLLTSAKEDLCGSCHDLASAELTKSHSGFSVAASNCQNCHEAHVGPKGSKGLLLPNKHAPFTVGNCNSCHQNNQANQLTSGVKTLCLNCHSDFAKQLNKPVVHAPAKDENGCTGCHGPHVGYGKSLQKQQGVATCIECHNTPEFTGAVKHAPAFEDCGTCHEVHSGDHKKLLMMPDVMELCMNCHPKAKETHYHPMGDGIIDPRTRENLNCVGCHSPHSSEFQSILIADRDRKLCVQCHDLAH